MFRFKAIFAFEGSFCRFKILGRVFDHNRDTIGLFSLTHLCGKLRCAWQWIIHLCARFHSGNACDVLLHSGYTSRVKAAEACPRFICTVFTSSPFCRERTAKVCPYGIITTNRRNPVFSMGLEVSSLVFDPFPTQKSSRELCRTVGGVSLATNHFIAARNPISEIDQTFQSAFELFETSFFMLKTKAWKNLAYYLGGVCPYKRKM